MKRLALFLAVFLGAVFFASVPSQAVILVITQQFRN